MESILSIRNEDIAANDETRSQIHQMFDRNLKCFIYRETDRQSIMLRANHTACCILRLEMEMDTQSINQSINLIF